MTRSVGMASLVWATLCVALLPCAQAQQSLADQQRLAWVSQLSAPMADPSGPPGRWFPWENQYGRVRSIFEQGGISKADGEVWDKQLRAIADFLKAAPVLSSATPTGFFPDMSGHINVLNAGSFVERPKQAPLVGGVTLYAWRPSDVQADATGAPKLNRGAHNVSFRVELNYVYEPGGMRDAEGVFGPLEIQGEFAGFPVYGNSLVVTRGGRLPYVPVSQERALNEFIARQEKGAAMGDESAARRRRAYEDYVSPEGRARRQAAIEAEARGVHPTMSEQARRRMEAIDRRREQDLLAEANQGPTPGQVALAEAKSRLAAMSAAERSAPAWWLPPTRQSATEIVPQGTPGARALLAFDPTFFDPSQPRHTLRIVRVRELHNVVDCAQRGMTSCMIYLQVLQATDWRAFADRFLK